MKSEEKKTRVHKIQTQIYIGQTEKYFLLWFFSDSLNFSNFNKLIKSSSSLVFIALNHTQCLIHSHAVHVMNTCTQIRAIKLQPANKSYDNKIKRQNEKEREEKWISDFFFGHDSPNHLANGWFFVNRKVSHWEKGG